MGTNTTNGTGFTTARYGHTSVVYNGYLYIIGGYGSSAYQNDIQYCPLNSNGSVGTCTRQTNAFTTGRERHASVTYNGYLYIIGGSGYLNDIQYCPLNSNGSVGTCTQQTSAFTTARSGHESIVYNGYLYIIGGVTSSSVRQNDIQYCPINGNGSVGTCTRQTSAFTAARYYFASAAYNGYLYIIGGSAGTNQNDLQYLRLGSPVSPTTTQGAAFTTARGSYTSVVNNGYLYIIGGWNGFTYFDDIQYCPINSNGSIGTCTQQTSAFTGARYGHTSVVSGGYLYIIGGSSTTISNDIQYCPINSNGSVGTCTQQTNAFTTARNGHTSVAYNGYLYIAGGNSGTSENDIQYIPLKTIADTARYERLFDTGSAANNLTSLTISGSTPTLQCLYTVTYKTAGSNGVLGSATTLQNVVPGTAQTLNISAQRYVFVVATLDDSTCGGTSTITSMELMYNGAPDAPTLVLPAASATNVNTLPEFRLGSTDDSNDYLRYKIDVCSTSNGSVVVRTIDQTSSQTGWTSQSLQSGTAYAGGATITQLAIHQYQPTPLSGSTQYWWRAQAADPGGTNSWGAYSAIGTFTTAAATRSQLSIGGGTSIYSGTNFSTGN